MRLRLIFPLFMAQFCLLLFGGPRANAQETWFEQLSSLNDLTHDQITDLHQDQFGYIWVATAHGLNQLDGYRVKTFRYSPTDPHSMKANFIIAIHEAPDGTLWLTHAIGGASVYDRATGQFSYEAVDKALPKEMVAMIYNVVWGAEGAIWLATNVGLYLKEKGKSAFERVPLDVGAEKDPYMETYGIWLRGDEVWVGTEKGLVAWHLGKKESRMVEGSLGGKQVKIDVPVGKMEPDGKGGMWMGTFGMGLLLADENVVRQVIPAGESEAFFSSMEDDGQGRLWVAHCKDALYVVENSGAAIDRKQVVVFDSVTWRKEHLCKVMCNDKGDCWAMGEMGRLHKVDRANGKLVKVENRNRKVGFVPGNFSSPAMMDRRRNLWLGSFQSGVFWQNPAKKAFELYNDFKEFGASDFMMDVLEAQDGKVWIATRERLLQLDPEKGILQPAAMDEFAFSILQDHKGRIWTTTRGAINVLDASGKLLRRYPNTQVGQQSSEFFTYQLHEDQNHRIWAIPHDGLICIDYEQDEVRRYRSGDSTIENGHLIRDLHCFFQDKQGTYWGGAIKYGLIKLEFMEGANGNTSARCTDFMFDTRQNKASDAMTVNAMFEDSRNNLWIGGYSSGLLKFDRKSHIFQPFLLPDGQAIPNIQAILEAPDGCLWISSNAGIFKFNPTTNRFRQFTHEDGLQSNLFTRHAASLGPSGRMYFGGMDGLNIFDPLAIPAPDSCIPPLIRGIRILGKPLHPKTPFERLESLDLGYRENFLDIDYVSIDFNHASKIRYSYMLEGLDKSWVDAQGLTATYTNLPPGDYVFKVRAAFEGRPWPAMATALRISIAPPFWQTTWFFLVVVIAICGLGLLIHFARIRAKVRQFRAIEAIRKKAAADFHDELGHRVTRISLFTEVLGHKFTGDDQEVHAYLEKIRVNSQDLYHSMRNFLWALDPEKDSAYELAILLKDFGDELFDRTGISFHVTEFSPELKKISLNMDWKRHLVLIFKEAMHNALKHANGGHVRLSVYLANAMLHVDLTDEGKGFDVEAASKGFGIRNMQDRAAKLAGKLRIASLEGKGTRVSFEGMVP